MSKPPKPHPRCHKVRHHSRKEAVKARNNQIKFLDFQARDRGSLEVYRCGTCGGFHVGNNNPDYEDEDKHPIPYKRERPTFDTDEE